MAAPRVALIGMHGHGRVHLDGLLDRHRAGQLVLCGVADVRAPGDAELLAGRVFDTDAIRLLERVRPDIVVIASPAHTHRELAERAMLLGAHVLLEKPPVTDLTDFARVGEAQRATGGLIQVGFQSLGSHALGALTAATTAEAMSATPFA